MFLRVGVKPCDDPVHVDEHLAHARYERDLALLALADQPVVDGLELGIPPLRDEGGHVEGSAHVGPPPANGPGPFEFPTFPGNRRQPGQRGRLAASQRAQLGHQRGDGRRRDGAHAGDVLQRPGNLVDPRIVLHHGGDLSVQPRDPRLDEPNDLAEHRPARPPEQGELQEGLDHGPDLHQKAAGPDQVPQRQTRLRRRGRRLAAALDGVQADYPGVDPVGLGQDAAPHGVVPHAERVQDADLLMQALQLQLDEQAVVSRRLDGEAHFGLTSRRLADGSDQPADALLRVLDDAFEEAVGKNVQLVLCHVDSDVEHAGGRPGLSCFGHGDSPGASRAGFVLAIRSAFHYAPPCLQAQRPQQLFGLCRKAGGEGLSVELVLGRFTGASFAAGTRRGVASTTPGSFSHSRKDGAHTTRIGETRGLPAKPGGGVLRAGRGGAGASAR